MVILSILSPPTSARSVFFKHRDNAIEKNPQKFETFLFLSVFHGKHYESCLSYFLYEYKARNTIGETNLYKKKVRS